MTHIKIPVATNWVVKQETIHGPFQRRFPSADRISGIPFEGVKGGISIKRVMKPDVFCGQLSIVDRWLASQQYARRSHPQYHESKPFEQASSCTAPRQDGWGKRKLAILVFHDSSLCQWRPFWSLNSSHHASSAQGGHVARPESKRVDAYLLGPLGGAKSIRTQSLVHWSNSWGISFAPWTMPCCFPFSSRQSATSMGTGGSR